MVKRPLREFLLLTNTSQSELARVCGLSRQTVHNWQERKAPVYVEWDLETDRVEAITREEVLFQAPRRHREKQPKKSPQ